MILPAGLCDAKKKSILGYYSSKIKHRL